MKSREFLLPPIDKTAYSTVCYWLTLYNYWVPSKFEVNHLRFCDARHREECNPMDNGKQNIYISPKSILEWSASRNELHGYQNKALIISKLQSTRRYYHLINPHTRYSATRLMRVLLLTLTTSNNSLGVWKVTQILFWGLYLYSIQFLLTEGAIIPFYLHFAVMIKIISSCPCSQVFVQTSMRHDVYLVSTIAVTGKALSTVLVGRANGPCFCLLG